MTSRTLLTLTVLLTLAVPTAAVAAPGEVDWRKGTITVVGEGAPSQAEENPAKRRLMAKRAAIVDGYRKVAEAIAGVRVNSSTTVKNFETQDDDVRSEVNGLVKGAEIIEENVTSDGVYEVKLVVPLFGEHSVAAAVLETSLNAHRRRLPESQASEPRESAEATPQTAFTGVILDARNLGAQAAMAPALLDEQGQELYLAKLPVNPDDVVAQGAVSYAKSLDEAKGLPRIGDRPLVLRPKRAKGAFRADLVLSASDAKRLLEAEASTQVLSRLAVVIVL